MSNRWTDCGFDMTATTTALNLNGGTSEGIGYSTEAAALDTVLAQYGKSSTPNAISFTSHYHNPWDMAAIDLSNDFLRCLATLDVG